MEFYSSGKKTLWLMVLGVVMLAMCVWVFFIGGTRSLPVNILCKTVSVIGVLFFGLCFVVCIRDWLRKGPVLIINEEGIDDKRLRTGLIPWDEVDYIKVADMEAGGHSNRFLSVHVDDEDKYLARMPGYRRMFARFSPSMGYSVVSIPFNTLSPGLDDAI